MMARRRLLAVTLWGALSAAGCSSMDEYSGPRTIIPARTLNVSPSLTLSAEAIVAAGVLYAVIDPLAPNWKVEVEPVGQQRYRVVLTMKRFITGGEGESAQVLRRTAEKLQKQNGYSDYAVLAYSEGIESHVLIAQRVAHGLIELR
jgi:hypothetical protein